MAQFNGAFDPNVKHYGMQTYFQHNVQLFISGSTEPRWNAFLNLIDQLTRLISQEYPATQEYYKDFMLKFTYEETSLPQFQSDLAALLAHEPLLYDYFATFLRADIASASKQAAAKRYFCALTGLPTASPGNSRQASMNEVSVFSKTVQERFRDCPGKVRDFVSLSLRRWRDGNSHSARSQLLETIQNEHDLVEFFERMWPDRDVRL